jgi:hypothetical protein
MFLTNLNLGGDESRPSFFEVIAQSRLYDGLKPALKALILVNFVIFSSVELTTSAQFGAQRYPSLFTAVNYSEEIFYSLMLLLETHYLQEYGTQTINPHSTF